MNHLTKKPAGDAGAEFKLTAQSMNVWLPRIANTTVFMLSIGTDFMTIALVPILQSALTCVSRSALVGFVYTRWEYEAARQSKGYVGI